MISNKKSKEAEFDPHEFDLPPEREYELIESQRIPKGKFNIFDVAKVNEEANLFELFFYLVLGSICLCGIGICMFYFELILGLAIFFVILPFFTLISFLVVAPKNLAHAKQIFRSGRAYLGYIDSQSLGLDCILCINGKIVKQSIIGGSSLLGSEKIRVIYSAEFDEFLFLKLNKNNNFTSIGNDGYFAEEDMQIEKYLEKINSLD